MSLTISDEIIEAAGMSETEFLREIAIMLFRQERISLGLCQSHCPNESTAIPALAR